jgi:hypothetical protein
MRNKPLLIIMLACLTLNGQTTNVTSKASDTNWLSKIDGSIVFKSTAPTAIQFEWMRIEANTDCGTFHGEQTTIEVTGFKPVVTGSSGSYTISFAKEDLCPKK